MKFRNNAVAIFVVAIIGLIFIPLPTFFLDLMFLINISISLMILLHTMYIKEALEFSIFPSLLLITTIFRLALNISSTRLILSEEGQAGAVIETFGSFVLRGNIVVGFIIFLIIVVVQFLVISKGTERISEVAARFTLDAMPGKQMAIDADLNSGMITEEDARVRRYKIQKEADFYGAMDGATKLVKGDAIASIIITFANLIAGCIIGIITSGKTFSEVMTIYSIATVGDGLVSQIPALMISVATGMIVTRAASDNSLSLDVSNQFFSQKVVLQIAGGVMIVLCFMPGMPVLQLFVVGAVLLALSTRLSMKQRADLSIDMKKELAATEEVAEVSEIEYYKNVDNIYSILAVDPIEMEFGYSLIPLVDESTGGSFIDRVVMFRRQFALDMGMVIPSVRLKDNGYLNPNQYVVKLKGEAIAMGEILVDYYLALDPGNISKEIDGIETIEPAYGIPSKWITEDKKELAEIYGYTVIDPLSVMLTHLSEVIKTNAYELFNRQDLMTLLENVKQYNPTIVEEVVPQQISYNHLQKVLSNLLKESIPIRDMETILETISNHAGSIRDTDMITEYCRQALRRTISRKFADNNQMKVIVLDMEVEKIILNGVTQNDFGSYISLDPEMVQNIVTSVTEQVERLKEVVNTPIVLTSPVVRVYFKKITEQFCPNIIVLSFNEVDNMVQIQALGNITLKK